MSGENRYTSVSESGGENKDGCERESSQYGCASIVITEGHCLGTE